ncbi:MAG TPA: hypothetical protein VGR56_06270 [Nitrososphaerales archaeon]|nr:hypothetical protein [Nitrososphaerales archaeon]
MAYYLDIQNRPVKHRMPNDVPYLVTFAPSIAILKHGEDPEWAEKAFDFGISEDWQSRVESFGGKIPTRTGIPSSSRVPDDAHYFPNVADAKKILENLSEVKRIRENAA